MCFSASASFGAGIVLAVIGVATIKKREQPSQIYFAAIPFLFCIQQISEGFLWLALQNPIFSPLEKPSIYIFLFLAQVVWPLWLPLAVLKLEQEKARKKMLLILLAIGMLVSFYLAYCLFSYNVHAKIVGYHISYQQDYPIRFGGYGDFLYIAATILPPLISSIKRMWILGIIILVSYIITMFYYVDNIISVWCFFASAISFMVLYILQLIKNKEEKPSLIKQY
jgi:hypothetical protein